MGRQVGQVTMQGSTKDIRTTNARKGEDTYAFCKPKQKKEETMPVSENFIEELKK